LRAGKRTLPRAAVTTGSISTRHHYPVPAAALGRVQRTISRLKQRFDIVSVKRKSRDAE
jgi:hypothetical protein